MILTLRKDLISSYFFILHPLSQGLPTLPGIFLRKGIMEPALPGVFYCPPSLIMPPSVQFRFGDEAMWRKVWQGVVFMQNFWNSKTIPDTEIILTSIQSNLILKKFKWFLWRGYKNDENFLFCFWWKTWSHIWLVKMVQDLIWEFQKTSLESIHFICMNNDLVRMRK